MTTIALDFALLACLAAHAELLAFALRAALTPASILSTLGFVGAPGLMVFFAWRMMRQFGRAIGAGILIVRGVCAVRCRRIHRWTMRRWGARSQSVNSVDLRPIYRGYGGVMGFCFLPQIVYSRSSATSIAFDWQKKLVSCSDDPRNPLSYCIEFLAIRCRQLCHYRCPEPKWTHA